MMANITAVSAFVLALVLESMVVNAASPVLPEGQLAEGPLEMADPDDMLEALRDSDGPSSAADQSDPQSLLLGSSELGTPNDAQIGEGETGVAFPVTEAISLAVDYELEEVEDLAADGMKMGTTGAEYANHSVMVRARWQFDVLP